MKRSSSRAAMLLAAGLTALLGCSTAPGPGPGMPAPEIPEVAVAYDELKSVLDRPFPFTSDCSQFTQSDLIAAGLAGSAKDDSYLGGCILDARTGSGLHQVWVRTESPPDASVPAAFPSFWDGRGHSGYFRRVILMDRYYAVKSLKLQGLPPTPRCEFVVDTGSPNAVRFAGVLPEAEGLAEADKIMIEGSAWNIDKDAAASFMDRHCPTMQAITEALMESSIDPGGGSLATQ